MKELELFIDYDFITWNDYIYYERMNKYMANKIKHEIKKVIHYKTIGKKYKGKYPVEITFKPHFKNKKRDLDNTFVKGLLDGLVFAEVIKNDNLNCIQRIILEPVFDENIGIEIKIKEI